MGRKTRDRAAKRLENDLPAPRLLALVDVLFQPSLDGLPTVPYVTAHSVADWAVALIPPAVQGVDGYAQHFRDIRQRHQLVTGLQCHDHLLSWRRLVNLVIGAADRSSPASGQTALQPFTRRRACLRILRTFRSTKPLSHEAAACGREDRHRTGGAVILVWVGIMLVRMAEIPETSSSRTRLGAPRESTVERGAGPPTCAE